MNAIFERAWAKLVGIEGGFSDNPHDRGGATRWGVTEAVARADGYLGEMAELPLERAQRIAKANYWDVLRLDDVAMLDERLAFELLDTAYNMGPGRAAEFLQRCLRALNRSHRDPPDYPEVLVDGQVGPFTLAALAAFIRFRGATGRLVLLRALNSLQGARYVELCEGRERNEEFLFGWLRERVEIPS